MNKHIIRRTLALLTALVLALGMGIFQPARASAAVMNYDRRYNQDDPIWGESIRQSSCMIFSFANAIYALNGNSVDIMDMCSWAIGNKSLRPGNGGGFRDLFYPKVEAAYGERYNFTLASKSTYSNIHNSALKNHLMNGGVATAHVYWHFIAITDYNPDTDEFYVIESYVAEKRGLEPSGWVPSSYLYSHDRTIVDWFMLISNRTAPVTDEPIAPYPRPTGSPVIQNGSFGIGPKWVQYTLSEQLGYDIGQSSLTSYFSNGTENAVRAFQSDHGLESSGVVDAQTIEAIVAAVYDRLNPAPEGTEMEAGAGQLLPDGPYHIQSKMNYGYSLGADADNAVMQMTQDRAVWTLTYLDNGYYRITLRDTDQCLTVSEGDRRRGTNVVLAPESGGIEQQWSLEPAEQGFALKARCSGFCLDIDNAALADGTNVLLWEESETDNQRFCFVPEAASVGQTLADGIYQIACAENPAFCLDVFGIRENGEYHPSSNVQLWDRTTDDTFAVTYQGGGLYTIAEPSTGYVLDIETDFPANYLQPHSNISIYTNNGSRNQLWMIRQNADRSYSLISAYNGYCLTLNGGSAEYSGNIESAPADGSRAQNWLFGIAAPKPALCSLKTNTQQALIREAITLTAAADTDAAYVLTLEKDGEVVETADMPEGSLTLYIGNSGTYTARVSAYNANGTAESAPVEITVGDALQIQCGASQQLPYDPQIYSFMTTDADTLSVDENGEITGVHEGTALVFLMSGGDVTSLLSVTVAAETLTGDCNADGTVDDADLQLLSQWLTGRQAPLRYANADINADGRLNGFDLALLRQMRLGDAA